MIDPRAIERQNGRYFLRIEAANIRIKRIIPPDDLLAHITRESKPYEIHIEDRLPAVARVPKKCMASDSQARPLQLHRTDRIRAINYGCRH